MHNLVKFWGEINIFGRRHFHIWLSVLLTLPTRTVTCRSHHVYSRAKSLCFRTRGPTVANGPSLRMNRDDGGPRVKHGADHAAQVELDHVLTGLSPLHVREVEVTASAMHSHRALERKGLHVTILVLPLGHALDDEATTVLVGLALGVENDPPRLVDLDVEADAVEVEEWAVGRHGCFVVALLFCEVFGGDPEVFLAGCASEDCVRGDG